MTDAVSISCMGRQPRARPCHLHAAGCWLHAVLFQHLGIFLLSLLHPALGVCHDASAHLVAVVRAVVHRLHGERQLAACFRKWVVWRVRGKLRVYQHSTLAWQRDDIEYAIASYVEEMNAELYQKLADGRKDFLLSHVRFQLDLEEAVERLENLSCV